MKKLEANEMAKDRMKGYATNPSAAQKAGRQPKHYKPSNAATGKGITFSAPANKR